MKFSLCMIVKNEEAVLNRCLESMASAMDEIIIVDTGSTDATKKPVVTATPKAEPEVTEPPTTIDDDPSDVPSDNTQPDDVGGDTGDDTE